MQNKNFSKSGFETIPQQQSFFTLCPGDNRILEDATSLMMTIQDAHKLQVTTYFRDNSEWLLGEADIRDLKVTQRCDPLKTVTSDTKPNPTPTIT